MQIVAKAPATGVNPGFDFEVQVLNRFARLSASTFAFADVDAARESNAAIGHEKLAMVVEVHRGEPPRSKRGKRIVRRTRGAFNLPTIDWPGITRARVVNQRAPERRAPQRGPRLRRIDSRSGRLSKM